MHVHDSRVIVDILALIQTKDPLYDFLDKEVERKLIADGLIEEDPDCEGVKDLGLTKKGWEFYYRNTE